jgi:predicted O-methyltransferase YrrM
MPKGNSREPLNRWFVLLLAVCSSTSVGIWIGWTLGRAGLSPPSSAAAAVQLSTTSSIVQSKNAASTNTKSSMKSSLMAETVESKKNSKSASAAAAKQGAQQGSDQSTVEQPSCDLSSNLQHLQNNDKFDYPRQLVAGPMQADEMLVLFAMVRTSFVRRVLEIGGWKGDSAYNWLEALRCKNDATVYTVDRRVVPRHDHPAVTHKTILKDAATLVLVDIDNEPIDLLLLDCHAYEASQHIFNAVIGNNLLSRNGFIVLHDTGLHPKKFKWPFWPGAQIPTDQGIIHQPVERLLADWIPLQDCSFQRISFHHDDRYAPRHGMTILQRRTDLTFDKQCNMFANGTMYGGMYDFKAKDCQEVHAYTTKVQQECPTTED